ncbi:Predicted transcriptional regulator, ArsR family [Arthrobacter sp. cf158]|uniref:helix-turn-helix transcriptional regulator n=1 Tax=unclassified Arthrobacter TaxID=235627 RepID=UPI000898B431|nr:MULTISPECIES: transcriptional regulator [unclassified Arthrobacter]SDW30645.1 Predicted transcriptional regulator, ArsR family [Arthrobacter sp. cf158]
MGTSNLPWSRRIAALASLGDVNRRKLFEYVLGAGDAVGRDEAATAMHLPRSTASFHLDRLVREGLLRIEFRKAPDKAGPGSGRPAKLYRPALAEVSASVPERNYDLAGELLASGISQSLAEGIPVSEALLTVADAKGQLMGRAGDFLEVLAGLGYQPSPDPGGGYRLLNCPFHRLSQEHKDVVCAMNGAFLKGAAVASGLNPAAVVPDAGPGHCCARIATVEGQRS